MLYEQTQRGVVATINEAKGCFFITPEVGGKNIYSGLGFAYAGIKVGDRVIYTLSSNAKGYVAKNVKKCEQSIHERIFGNVADDVETENSEIMINDYFKGSGKRQKTRSMKSRIYCDGRKGRHDYDGFYAKKKYGGR